MNKVVKLFLKRIFPAVIFCVCLGLCFLAAHCLYEYTGPAHRVQQTLVMPSGRIRRALFSPDDNPQDTLITLIQAEREKISIAAFSFTSVIIAQELVKAKNRGVKIDVIADGQSCASQYSKIPLLRENNISVRIYPSEPFHDHTHRNDTCSHENGIDAVCPTQPDENLKTSAIGIMHNKFMIFKRSLLNRSILWTGSYNFTRSANNKNQENIIITEDLDLIRAYREQFEKIKLRCIKQATET